MKQTLASYRSTRGHDHITFSTPGVLKRKRATRSEKSRPSGLDLAITSVCCIMRMNQKREEFTYSGIAAVCPLQKPPVSHFNCIILVKNSTTFFRTVFFARDFYILSIEPVEQTRKENTSSFVCPAEGFVGNISS